MKVLKVVVLGASGMLGHKLFIHLSRYDHLQVYATVRSPEALSRVLHLTPGEHLHSNVDAYDFNSIRKTLVQLQPDLVINCIGTVKQSSLGQDPISCISINALLPHQIAELCGQIGARLLHISTDCVFSGQKGNYAEDDFPDAADLYGRTKLLGEVAYPHCLTLRTSIIGHELQTKMGLIEWFMGRQNSVKGYTRHIFSGFPTTELAKVIVQYLIPNPEIHGIYHLSSAPISKYELLQLVALKYGKDIEVEPFGETVCDRSLDSRRLRGLTAYSPPSWPEMIDEMYQDFKRTPYVRRSEVDQCPS